MPRGLDGEVSDPIESEGLSSSTLRRAVSLMRKLSRGQETAEKRGIAVNNGALIRADMGSAPLCQAALPPFDPPQGVREPSPSRSRGAEAGAAPHAGLEPCTWCGARSQSPGCAVDRDTEVPSQPQLSRANRWSKQRTRWPCDDAGDAARLTQARGAEGRVALAEEVRKDTGRDAAGPTPEPPRENSQTPQRTRRVCGVAEPHGAGEEARKTLPDGRSRTHLPCSTHSGNAHPIPRSSQMGPGVSGPRDSRPASPSRLPVLMGEAPQVEVATRSGEPGFRVP